MKTIRINKQQLVAIVTKNRDAHAEEHAKALPVWHKDQLDKLLLAHTALSANPEAKIDYGILLQKPTSHLEDYDRVLRMLALSADEVIELTEGEYRNFVEDEFDWTRSFKAVTASYAGR
jgi:hypothetical protein